MHEFVFNYKYGIGLLSCGRDTITVNADDEYSGKLKAIKELKEQERYFGFWLEII